jgi:hypothetical protein
MKLKKFSEFFSGVNEDSGYPAGAEFDPSAPWNKKDPELERESELKPSEIKFDLVAWDGNDHAILKEKNSDKMFAAYIDTSDDEFRKFVAIPREYIGDDEDGSPEYEYEHFDPQFIDDTAIVSYVSEIAKNDGTGVGLDGWDSGEVSEIDEELASDIVSYQKAYLEKLKSGPSGSLYSFRQEKIKPLEEFVEILSKKFNL